MRVLPGTHYSPFLTLLMELLVHGLVMGQFLEGTVHVPGQCSEKVVTKPTLPHEPGGSQQKLGRFAPDLANLRKR